MEDNLHHSLGDEITAPPTTNAGTGRESSGRGLYIGPKFNQRARQQTTMNQYINESFHVEEEEKKRHNTPHRHTVDVANIRPNNFVGRPQKKSLSDDGSVEEFKMQIDERSSSRGSFEHQLFKGHSNSKNTIFTVAQSSNASNNPSHIMNTDYWALSLTKHNNNTNKKRFFLKMLLQAVQTGLFLLLEWFPFIISLHNIGTSENSLTTGGYGMGIVWSNCFIEFIFGGLGLGLQILVTQAISENKMNTAMNLFKKGIVIVTVSMIPLIILMFLSGLIIEGISGNSALGNYTYQYCTYGLPAFFFNGIYNILKGYLRARKQSMLAFVTIAFSAGTSIFWNWLFILKLDLESEVVGAALARNVIEFINVVLLFVILYRKNYKEVDFNFKFTKYAFKGWTELTKFCLPIGGLLFLEWFGYELFTFQATHLTDSEFSAHVILNIFNTVYYQVAYGIAIAITSQVNQEMLVQDLVSTLRSSKIGIGIILAYVFITMMPLAFVGPSFSTTFTNDVVAQQNIQDNYGLFLTCLAMDAVLAGIVGITRGIGKQKIAAVIFIVSFFILGQVLASIFSYILDGGLVGIWLSILASIFIANVSQVIWTGFTDWEKSLVELQSHKQKEEKERKKMMYNRVKSRDSLIQYDENDLDYEDVASQTEHSQVHAPVINEKYDITQVILEKEENNSTINANNSTFTMKLNKNNLSASQSNNTSNRNNSKNSNNNITNNSNNLNKNNNNQNNNIQSSIFTPENAINSSDKIVENVSDEDPHSFNIQEVSEDQLSETSKQNLP